MPILDTIDQLLFLAEKPFRNHYARQFPFDDDGTSPILDPPDALAWELQGCRDQVFELTGRLVIEAKARRLPMGDECIPTKWRGLDRQGEFNRWKNHLREMRAVAAGVAKYAAASVPAVK
jgi:hypothetical protein